MTTTEEGGSSFCSDLHPNVPLSMNVFLPYCLSICPLWSCLQKASLPPSPWVRVSGSVLSGQGLHSLQKVQGQTVLCVVLWEDFNQTADQPAGVGQGDQGAPQLTGVHSLEPCAEGRGQAGQQLHGSLGLALAVEQGVAQSLASQHQQLGTQHILVFDL